MSKKKKSKAKPENWRHVSEFNKSLDGIRAEGKLADGSCIPVIKAGEHHNQWLNADTFQFVEPVYIKQI